LCVVGGYLNYIEVEGGVVGGGSNNIVLTGDYSSIGGGEENTVSGTGYATIGGGG